MRSKEKWESRLAALQEDYKLENQKVFMWREQLRQEEEDVDRLCGMSFSSFFYTVIGKKAEKLEQEQKEVLEAKLKYDEAVLASEDLRQEVEECRAKLGKVHYSEAEYNSLLRQKAAILREHYPDIAEELNGLTDSATEANQRLKELNEALFEGKGALAALQNAEEALESAKRWGTYDMLGGGMIATHVKHDRIDRALSYAHEARKRLVRFQKELQDIGLTASTALNMDGFVKFADYFFDGLLADWAVQDKISNAYAHVVSRLSDVRALVRQLEEEVRKAESECALLERKLTACIENAK